MKFLWWANYCMLKIYPMSMYNLVIDLSNEYEFFRCFTTDSLPRGYPGQYVRASAYAELDGKRKRQSIYPGSGPRS